MKRKKTQQGFTLIELLVVIAVIGVLASVVLASLGAARKKGNDAAVKSNLTNARTQAELYYYDNSNSYGTAGAGTGVCTSGTNNINVQVTAALAASAKPAAYDSVAETCFVTAGGWAAAMQLTNPTTTTFACVDSSGASKEVLTTYPISTSDVAC